MLPKKINPEIDLIQERFFCALDMLIQNNEVASLHAFCQSHNLNRVKYHHLVHHYKDKSETTYKLIDIDAIAIIVRSYKVSADWLITGAGSMFN